MPLARIDSTKGLVIDNQSGATGNLMPSQMPSIASTAVNRWTMSESSGTTFTDSIASQVLTYSPLGSSVLTYGANRVMAISSSVDFAPTASDTTSILSCASASFPTVSSAGQARMIEAYLRFNNVPSPIGGTYIAFGMRLDTNNRVVVYVSSSIMSVYSSRNGTVSSLNGPNVSSLFGAFGNNRALHLIVAENQTTLSLYVNGQVYSASPNSLYTAGTYSFTLCNDLDNNPMSTPTSVEIAEITLHNGLIPTGYASTQAYATARAMLLDKRW